MATNTLYPNTFQHPNAYIDALQYYLTGNEEKVLNRIIREIMGWEEKRQTLRATVSISTLVEGKISKTGERLSYGCGLKAGAVRNALRTLVDFRIIEAVGNPGPNGQTYALQLDLDAMNWEAMTTRRESSDSLHEQQIAGARATLTPSVQQNPTPSVQQEATPSVQQNPKNKRKQTPKSPTGASAPSQPALIEKPDSGNGSEDSIPTSFQGWQDLLRETGNRSAVLRRMHETLFPALDAPDYGRIGSVAKKVGGASVLALKLWELSTRPPVGDVLSYIQKSTGNGNYTKRTTRGSNQFTPERMAEFYPEAVTK